MPLHRRIKENDRRKELQFYMEQETENLQGKRPSVEEARFAARRHLGNPALVQEKNSRRLDLDLAGTVRPGLPL